MSWKNMPYWLRGGIIGAWTGVILGIILLIFSFICDFASRYCPEKFWDILKNIFLLPLAYIPGVLSSLSLMLIFLGIEFFIAGALIGLIIGKIKRKR
jgi:O-antigen/teichoic acid export membrane protein